LRLPRKAASAKKAARRAAQDALPAADRDLFEKLRLKRQELARAQNVPPYVIFHDRTLQEMAARGPRTLAALGVLSGVGENTLARHGDMFLRVIHPHAPDAP